MSFCASVCVSVCVSMCVCVSQLMNPIELKREAPTTLLQDPFTAAVNLQESHQCVSECA